MRKTLDTTYKMDASSNFTYDGFKGANTKASITTAKTSAWKAVAKATLNDCTVADAKWGIDILANSGTGGSVNYQAAMASTANCLALTPNWAAFSTDKTTIGTTVQ